MLQMNKEPTAEALAAAAEHNEVGMFMVFAFESYYPLGGFNDFLGLALSLDQARAMVADHGIALGSYQIVNYKNMEIVETKKIGWEN